MSITSHYDADADILYIDFGFKEPCFTENIDDLLMIDIGWFSKTPCDMMIVSPEAYVAGITATHNKV